MNLSTINPHHSPMGIINLTPDSFSDGGTNYEATAILANIQRLLDSGLRIIDFGAESTAPMNKAITAHQEQERFSQLLNPLLDRLNIPVFSIDTYRPETFFKVREAIRKVRPEVWVIWNDVSGVMDTAVQEVLSSDSKTAYVFSHNLARERAKTNQHMDFLDESLDIIEHTQSFFSDGIKRYESWNLENPVYLDPCFGFSKSLEQNYLLMNQLPKLLRPFSNYGTLLGISRKSFLKKFTQGENVREQMELQQVLWLAKWREELAAKSVIYRLHDPNVWSSLETFLNNLSQEDF